jgi:hypothetical protein
LQRHSRRSTDLLGITGSDLTTTLIAAATCGNPHLRVRIAAFWEARNEA